MDSQKKLMGSSFSRLSFKKVKTDTVFQLESLYTVYMKNHVNGSPLLI